MEQIRLQIFNILNFKYELLVCDSKQKLYMQNRIQILFKEMYFNNFKTL